MSAGNFIKKNFVLVAGLALPVLLMLCFFIAANLPATLEDPPEYDMVFSVQEYRNGDNLPLEMGFVVKEGVLKVVYTPSKNPGGSYYRDRLYIYDASEQDVRELAFELPGNVDKIKESYEEAVEATKGMKIDTRREAPDGYELSYKGYSHSGLMNELFWGGSGRNTPRLRKGYSSVPLMRDEGRRFYYYDIRFLGWVVP